MPLTPPPPVLAERGVFVCFEGGEGSGKSTQSRRLQAWLEAAAYDVVLTFEPGDTPVGRQVRQIVLSPETGELADRVAARLSALEASGLWVPPSRDAAGVLRLFKERLAALARPPPAG